MTDLFTEYPEYSESQQQRFRDCVTRLLSGHIVSPGAAINPDPDWLFIDRHSDAIQDYLNLAGWRLDVDRRLGVARVLHERGEQRVHLPKLESLAFCVLRLFYHEQRLHMREDDRCYLTVGELRERLIHAGAPAISVSRAKLRDAMRTLTRYHLVEIPRGFAGEDDETVQVNEVVEKILSADRIEQYFEEFRETPAYSDDQSAADSDVNAAED